MTKVALQEQWGKDNLFSPQPFLSLRRRLRELVHQPAQAHTAGHTAAEMVKCQISPARESQGGCTEEVALS